MSDQPETVTIHAARRDHEDDIWLQGAPELSWYCLTGEADPLPNLAALEECHGPTRPVRIVTTDPEPLPTTVPCGCSELTCRRQVLNVGDVTAECGERELAEATARLRAEYADLRAAPPKVDQGRARQHGRQVARRYGLDPGIGELAGHIAADIVAGWIRDGSVPE